MLVFTPKRFLSGALLLSFCLSGPLPAANYKAFQSQGRHIITLNGRFEVGESQRFRQFLSAHKKTQYILFQSYGGSLKEAMKVGKIIRQTRLKTAVETYCYSACFVALMSGESRYVYDGAYIGVHRPFFERKEHRLQDKEYSPTYQSLSRYFQFMLGKPHSQSVVNLMYKTPSNSMYQVGQAESYLQLNYYSRSGL